MFTKSKNIFLGIAFLLISVVSNAQCAMCRASLESSGDTSQGEAVNDGIVYLMAIPYILVAVMAYVIYRMYTKKKEG
jgi:heme/copper-type cytochrome/quinol oxidase subunit 2